MEVESIRMPYLKSAEEQEVILAPNLLQSKVVESCTASQLPKSNVLLELNQLCEAILKLNRRMPKLYCPDISKQFRMKSYSKHSIGHQQIVEY